MARLSNPMDLTVPTLTIQGHDFPIPADLPEGGHLQIVVGENPFGQAFPVRQIPKGCMVAIIPAAIAEKLREAVNRSAGYANDPLAVPGMPNGHKPRIQG